MAMIEAAGLARVFRSRRQTVEAVRGVDISVAEGEIVGFLGPNGAGKTTTLRMLTTLLRPTAGTATVAGADLLRDPVEVRRRIGYVAQAIGVTCDDRAARGARRGGFRGLGGVLRRNFLGVGRVLGDVLRVEVRRVVCGRLYASGLSHVALPHASLRHYWEICRISYGCGCCAWCGCVGPA